MRVRIKIRVWLVALQDLATGRTFPLHVERTRKDALEWARLNKCARDSGYRQTVRPYRYDELAQARRRARKTRRAQERSFQFAGDYQ